MRLRPPDAYACRDRGILVSACQAAGFDFSPRRHATADLGGDGVVTSSAGVTSDMVVHAVGMVSVVKAISFRACAEPQCRLSVQRRFSERVDLKRVDHLLGMHLGPSSFLRLEPPARDDSNVDAASSACSRFTSRFCADGSMPAASCFRGATHASHIG